jgi:putative FmdB family regulatory protein
MPIFEFECDRCGKGFECLVLSSSEASADCPECGCKDTKRVLSVFASAGGTRKSLPSCSHPPASGGGSGG